MMARNEDRHRHHLRALAARAVADSLRAGAGGGDRASRFEDCVRSLEAEKAKMEVFRRELPISVHLVADVIDWLKDELRRGGGGTVPAPARTDLVLTPAKAKQPAADAPKPEADGDDASDKRSWMSSAQLWTCGAVDMHCANGATSNAAAAANSNKQPAHKVSSAFVPPLAGPPTLARPSDDDGDAAAGKPAAVPVPDLSLSSPAVDGAAAAPSATSSAVTDVAGARRQNNHHHQQQQQQRKARRCWSPELHRRFVAALQRLGGAQVATPKQIRELMKVDGLTNDEVKSHLQGHWRRSRTLRRQCMWRRRPATVAPRWRPWLSLRRHCMRRRSAFTPDAVFLLSSVSRLAAAAPSSAPPPLFRAAAVAPPLPSCPRHLLPLPASLEMGFFGKKVPEPGPGVYRAHLLSYRDYPRDKDAPVLPSPLPVPYCDCGQPAEVQQSRDARTAGRAFYMCGTIEVDGEWPIKKCGFFKWIDGPDKYDPRIRLFPWRSHVTTPYHQFNRWVPPPPNPPEMTEEEKKEATDRRIMNPPFCHCGTPGRIIRPNPGVEFTPFFRCPLKRSAHWPTCEEIEEFTSGKKKWPCKSYPPKICKCGILARKGVVPSELAYGWYCGNSYGDFWEGRGCDYEYWEGQKEWITEVERCPDRKVRAYEERRREIRAKYGVLVPREEDWGKIREDMGAPRGIVHVDFETRMLRYWRNHRSRYAPPLPYGQQKRERAEERTKKIEREREEYRRRMSSSDDIDINATYPEGSWQECIQRIRRRKRAAAVEMETMRALVRNLPRVDPDGGNLGGDDGQA